MADGLTWIPCAERMPPEGDEVLTYEPGMKRPYAVDSWVELREAPVSFSTITVPTGFGWDSGVEADLITQWAEFNRAPGHVDRAQVPDDDDLHHVAAWLDPNGDAGTIDPDRAQRVGKWLRKVARSAS